MLYLAILLYVIAAVQAWSEDSILKYVDHLDLVADFIPNVPENKLAHHMRTPFAISEDGSTLYVAYAEGSRYLNDSTLKVHVQKMAPADFAILGQPCTIDGAKEASGLVSLNDGGFVILTTLDFLDHGPSEYDIPVVARYDQDCKPVWTRPVGGQTVPMAWLDDWPQPAWYRSPRLDGDLVYSPENHTYAAMFRTSYYGEWTSHGGDMIVYIDDSEDRGEIMVNYGTKHKGNETVTEPTSKTENYYSMYQRCAHEYGSAIASASGWPFPAVCTNDDGAIFLVTDNWLGGGVDMMVGGNTPFEAFGGEAFGGVHGSYSALASADGEAYLLAWVTRPTVSEWKKVDNCNPPPGVCVTRWCGSGFQQCDDVAKSRYVQILRLDHKTVVGTQLEDNTYKYERTPVSITDYRENIDCSNARITTFDHQVALLTWEEEEVEDCRVLTGCKSRNYTGTSFQELDMQGNPQGEAFKSTDVFISGDIIQVWDMICWPYVHMTWNTSWEELRKYPMEHEASSGEPFFTTKKLSFACMSMD